MQMEIQPGSAVQHQHHLQNDSPLQSPNSPSMTNMEAPAIPSKRKRRNMFDVKPEDLGVEAPKVDIVTDQIIDDESGDLIIGPGCGGLAARMSEAKRALPKLIREQEEKLAQAKRFAMEQSVQHVLNKQKTVTQVDVSTLQSTAQRQRAYGLMCKIYIGSINFQLNEDSIRASFLPFGPIKMVDLSIDPTTGRHKGFAFVEYELPEAAQLALEQMNNIMMGGRNIKVGRPSNIPQAAPWIDQILDEAKQYARVYVTSIHPDLSEQDIKSVFEAFGTVQKCQLTPDQMTGKHKGYGFIEFSTEQSANDAIVAMNLFDLGGQYIRVGRAITIPEESEKQAPPPAASVLAASAITASIQGQEAVSTLGSTALLKNTLINPLNSSYTSMPPADPVIKAPSMSTPTGVNPPPGLTASTILSPTLPAVGNQPTPEEKLTLDQQKKKAEVLDHALAGEQNLEREEKLEISGKDARYMMMQKLARAPSTGVVVLRNMVTVEEIDDDLEEEITEECSRFGPVNRVIIYQEKQSEAEDAEVIVKIFVEFGKLSEAEAAKNALNGRYFGGKVIQVGIYDEDKYRAQDYTG